MHIQPEMRKQILIENHYSRAIIFSYQDFINFYMSYVNARSPGKPPECLPNVPGCSWDIIRGDIFSPRNRNFSENLSHHLELPYTKLDILTTRCHATCRESINNTTSMDKKYKCAKSTQTARTQTRKLYRNYIWVRNSGGEINKTGSAQLEYIHNKLETNVKARKKT